MNYPLQDHLPQMNIICLTCSVAVVSMLYFWVELRSNRHVKFSLCGFIGTAVLFGFSFYELLISIAIG